MFIENNIINTLFSIYTISYKNNCSNKYFHFNISIYMYRIFIVSILNIMVDLSNFAFWSFSDMFKGAAYPGYM